MRYAIITMTWDKVEPILKNNNVKYNVTPAKIFQIVEMDISPNEFRDMLPELRRGEKVYAVSKRVFEEKPYQVMRELGPKMTCFCVIKEN